MIVEDQDFQRHALARLLSRLGAKSVLEASHGRAALEILAQHGGAIDIILSDLDMPDMDGMELIRHLAQSGVPVSVVLVSALDRNLVASIEAMTGAYGVKLLGTLEKPVSARALEALVAGHGRLNHQPSGVVADPGTDQILLGFANGEFEAFFQPKVELRTGRVRGAEALARWRRAADVRTPGSFMKSLESRGHAGELAVRMLDQAAACCREWHDAGFEFPVCVNVSLPTLSAVSACERIMSLTSQHGLQSGQVMVEVTESALAENLGAALETLSRLRLKGFGLAIDDYGTGYSSLQQLTRIPFTELKIDQSFVTGASRVESKRVILKSSLEMARQLGIVSVAEGVESEEDWNFLRDLGCDLGQGFFIAKPMPAGEFVQWLRDRAAR